MITRGDLSLTKWLIRANKTISKRNFPQTRKILYTNHNANLNSPYNWEREWKNTPTNLTPRISLRLLTSFHLSNFNSHLVYSLSVFRTRNFLVANFSRKTAPLVDRGRKRRGVARNITNHVLITKGGLVSIFGQSPEGHLGIINLSRWRFASGWWAGKSAPSSKKKRLSRPKINLSFAPC